MKKFLSYLLFTLATALPALSQSISSNKYDFNLSLPSLEEIQGLNSWQDTLPSINSWDNSAQLRQFDSTGSFLDKTARNNKLLYRQDENEIVLNTEPIYSLRIITPGGNHPIQIYKPDSTKNYTLLIKEF
ncbi:hypothetical protein SAMN04489724_4159 [Algoriphagus locisalis]|uniref:Uncharacterized protein n=1 Tax=Algoriphagus locisalis TaxID=305507 RepID=A0A1I7DME4_9BACT|nr:hypothetical protein [Algoriphagus locisalis]SFU12852.1 hypothetical protein SAMN04489724_4159 [Algoriphagus locisalis]